MAFQHLARMLAAMQRFRFARAAKMAVMVVLLLATTTVFGQVFDMERDRVQIADLKGVWRFHTGDDPRWSNPEFDDRSWELLSSTQPWSEQGHPGYGGFAWYRFQIIVPAHHGPLALYCAISADRQVFVNGRKDEAGPKRIGTWPHRGPSPLTLIPASAGADGKPIQIAIRVWHWPTWAAYTPGGAGGTSRIGTLQLMADWQGERIEARYWAGAASQIQILISILAGLAALSFFALYRLDREYLWFGLYELSLACSLLIDNSYLYRVVPHVGGEVLRESLYVVSEIFLFRFLWDFFKQRRTGLYWFCCVAAFTNIPSVLLGDSGLISVTQMNIVSNTSAFSVTVALLMYLNKQRQRREHAASLLITIIAVDSAFSLLYGITFIAFTAGASKAFDHLAWFSATATWPFPFQASDVADTSMQVVFIGVLIAHFARTRRDEQRLSSELEAARSVQHVMIPENIPNFANLTIEALYRPATEVSGDFFQVLPLGPESVLIAVGDVSGKGMPAAMTVSLVVGMLRGLSTLVKSPAAILQAINEQLVGHTSGFITCLLLRIENSKKVTLANAGHLSPYLDSHELEVEGALPLGLSAAAVYVESSFELPVGKQLTLLTDGVVEAQSADGELFGFSRTESMAASPAGDIAAAAQTFGQQDDITVLTIYRTASRNEKGSVQADAEI